MLQTVFNRIKDILPPKAGFRLRSIKSSLVDKELQKLLRFAKVVGGAETFALDVGANSGIYSAALLDYFDRVTAVEPNPSCVAYMKVVLPVSCAILPFAVSDAEGNAVLRVPVVRGSSETTRATVSKDNMFADLALSGTEEISVRVRTLDGLVADKLIDPKRLRLIKIDVEGHEAAVVRGAKALLSTASPGLCIEMERRHGTNSDSVVRLLSSLGYQETLSDGTPYLEDAQIRASDESVNRFFLKSREPMMLPS